MDAPRGKHKLAPDVPTLDENEKLAMTHAHPQSKRFVNALSKVVNSVQARKKLNQGYQDSQISTVQALPISSSLPEGQELVHSNFRYSGKVGVNSQ